MKQYQLCFYVPEPHLEVVKEALFKKGAGKLGNYDCCAWQTSGQGQFRPLASSNPFIGTVDKVEIVQEYKVEMICSAHYIQPVLTELIKKHPYETPAYSVYEIKTIVDFSSQPASID